VGHRGKFFALGGSEIGAVDGPVVYGSTVETVLLSQCIGYHFAVGIFLARYGVGFMFQGFLGRADR
jgi:hypothetical protein